MKTEWLPGLSTFVCHPRKRPPYVTGAAHAPPQPYSAELPLCLNLAQISLFLPDSLSHSCDGGDRGDPYYTNPYYAHSFITKKNCVRNKQIAGRRMKEKRSDCLIERENSERKKPVRRRSNRTRN